MFTTEIKISQSTQDPGQDDQAGDIQPAGFSQKRLHRSGHLSECARAEHGGDRRPGSHIELKKQLTTSRFAELIKKLAKKNKVVILIDEYDNPIISNINEIEKAKKIQEILRDFYKIIKSQDENIHFVFLTGVTKFSQVSVFSALNNLTDLTMNDNYAALCGYTEKEIKENFKDYINKWANTLDHSEQDIFTEIKTWYNGFRFSECDTKVYNPWSTLSFFNTGKFENYWFQTGTPTFLINLIKAQDNFILPDLSQKSVAVNSFSSFDIEKLQVLPLLVQTGYLTIKKYIEEFNEYILDFPNKEVKDSFIQNLLASQLENDDSDSLLSELRKSLLKNDLELFFESMDILLSKVDYDLHLKNEKYWQSLFYMILTLLGYKISAEFKTIKGRIDAVIETKTHIYIFEFKTTSSEEVALNQIKEREYYKRFKDSSKEIVLIGSRFVIEDKKLINKYISETI